MLPQRCNARRTAGAFLLLSLLLASPDEGVLAQEADGVAARQDDLAAFRREFMAVDHSFSPEARREAEARLAGLEQRLDAVSDARFQLVLGQVAALGDNGHTNVMAAGEAAARIPIRLVPFGTAFHVLRTDAAHSNLLGGRLVSIDAVPIAAIRDTAHTLFGGTAAHRDRLAPFFIEAPRLLHAAGVTRSPGEATYSFVMPDGSNREAMLAVAPTQAAGHGGLTAALYPAGGGDGWNTLLAPDRAPWALQESNAMFRRRDLPELNAVMIQLRVNVNAGGSIAAFLEQSDSMRQALGRANVVLDMRFNGGGNLQLTRDFMAELPRRLGPNGKIVVLTSPWTFSAAISSVGYLKQAGGDRVVIVGEEVGDRLEFWAEGAGTRLPRSGMFVAAARERHDYRTGCREFTDCHPPVVRVPIAVPTLAPDLEVPWTFADYAAGRDPALEAVGRLLVAVP